jgi:hypothetical protein
MTYLRFEYGQEDRMSEDLGPFNSLQMTYDALRVGPDGDREIAHLAAGLWRTDDGQLWSDFVVWSDVTPRAA